MDLSWNFNKIMAFLHAMDYGPLKMLGEPKVKYKSDTYTWDRYKVEVTGVNNDKNINLEASNKIITIQKDNHIITLFNIRMLKEESG